MRISQGISGSTFCSCSKPWPGFNKAISCLALAVLASVALVGNSNAATVVMDFGSAVSGGTTPSTYTQNGITMDATYNHFDIYGNSVGGTPTDNVAAIHNGNGAEEVKFTYSGGLFDLLSVDVTGFLIRGAGGSDFLTGTFASNLGGVHTVTGNVNDASAGVGVIDFSALGAQWMGISYFTLSVPLGVASCSAFCDILGFDDVTIADPISAVPIPAALPLFLSALGGLLFYGRRKQQATA